MLSKTGLNCAVIEAIIYFDPADLNTLTKKKYSWDSQRKEVITKIESGGKFDIVFVAGT